MTKFSESRCVSVIFIILFGLLTGCSVKAPQKAFTIESHKECPLCGMIPARYPRFHCQVILESGDYIAFDSAAGLITFLLFPDKTGMEPGKVDSVYFKDYLSETWIHSDKTFFVIGSEIMGPMGIEFLAVDSYEKAMELKKQEKGVWIIHYKKVDRQFMIDAAAKDWLPFLDKKLISQ